MSFTDDEKTPVVIIAYRKPGNHLVDSFKDLKHSFENIVVVGPENPHISRVIKENEGSWIVSESPHILELWETGIRVQNSVWYILIQDKEYLSSVLKENITETIRTKPVPSYFYPFDRKWDSKDRLLDPLKIEKAPKPISFSIDRHFLSGMSAA